MTSDTYYTIWSVFDYKNEPIGGVNSYRFVVTIPDVHHTHRSNLTEHSN